MEKFFIKKFIVEKEHLANTVQSGSLPVLSTPFLLAFIENSCATFINDKINNQENKTTVGVKVNLKHLKPNVVGDELECIGELLKVENNKYIFSVKVVHGDKLIGVCEHTRYLVTIDFYKNI